MADMLNTTRRGVLKFMPGVAVAAAFPGLPQPVAAREITAKERADHQLEGLTAALTEIFGAPVSARIDWDTQVALLWTPVKGEKAA